MDFGRGTPRHISRKDGEEMLEGDILDLKPSDAYIRASPGGVALSKADRGLTTIDESDSAVDFYNGNDDILSTNRRTATVTIYPPAPPPKPRLEEMASTHALPTTP